jgi:hypothetical protein
MPFQMLLHKAVAVWQLSWKSQTGDPGHETCFLAPSGMAIGIKYRLAARYT